MIDRPRDSTLDPHDLAPPSARALLVELYDAAVAGAAPGPLTAQALHDSEIPVARRVWLVAMGKAAHPMAAAAIATLHETGHRIAGGTIIAPELQPSPDAAVDSTVGDHPLPGPSSFAAAQRIGALAAEVRGDDVAVVLISGGATSLIGAPLGGLSDSDLVHLYELLLGSGLDIREMNAVRKRFTRWGAGRLALALAPARTHTFIVSDVEGDDPADIASGPCTPDPNTVHDVLDILHRSGVYSRIAPAMREHLIGVVQGLIPETPKATHPAFAHVSTRVIGSNPLATLAAAERAASLGLPVVRSDTLLSGDAARCGATLANALLERARAGWRGCMIWGGETTVDLASTGDARDTHSGDAPLGGRCQELALAASQVLAHGGEAASGITLLAAGTDGRDGPTDAAGAFADACVWEAIRASGHTPEQALARHDSYVALDAVHALHKRGHTGTNVMDVVIGVVQ